MIKLDDLILKYINDKNTLLDVHQAKVFAKEVVQKALELAANEATMERGIKDIDGVYMAVNVVDKQSILNIINKVV